MIYQKCFLFIRFQVSLFLFFLIIVKNVCKVDINKCYVSSSLMSLLHFKAMGVLENVVDKFDFYRSLPSDFRAKSRWGGVISILTLLGLAILLVIDSTQYLKGKKIKVIVVSLCNAEYQ